MNPRVIVVSLLLAAQAFCVRGDSAIDLIAGWRLIPFSYYYGDFYRYRGGYPYWHPSSYWGLGTPLSGGASLPFSGYPPAYGHLEHYVKLRLNSADEFPSAVDSLLPSLVGSAPLDLRDSQRETAWTHEINSLLGSFEQLEWPFPAATNVPPPTSVP